MASHSRKEDEGSAHFTYIWALENASYITLSNEVASPTFVVQSMDMSKCHLEAIFDEYKEILMLSICREEDSRSKIFEINFKFSLIESDLSTPYAEQTGQSQFQLFGSHRWGVIFNGDRINSLINNMPLRKEILTVRCQIWKTESNISHSELCFARTHLEVEEHFFVWAIKGFSALRPGQNTAIFLHSTFKNLPTLRLTFCLQEIEGKEYGFIKVHRNSGVGTYLMQARITLLDVEGWFVSNTDEYYRAWIADKKEKVCEFSKICEKSEIISNSAMLLTNDVLSLRCELTINAGHIWNRIENYRQMDSPDVEAFASKISDVYLDSTANAFCPLEAVLKTLLEDGTLSDISLKAGGQLFNVHKNILGSRAPFFKTMFTTDMKEKTAKCVDIPDINADTLRRLLLYIYTNRVEELQWESASDLFKAADKYELLDPREICSNYFKSNLFASNVCDILVLGDIYHDEDLRKAAEGFISQNSGIFHSAAWENLKKDRTKLAFETTERIISNMRNSRR